MVSLGEMATYIPVSGAFTSFATRFVDPSLGFAMGWIYWFSCKSPVEWMPACIDCSRVRHIRTRTGRCRIDHRLLGAKHQYRHLDRGLLRRIYGNESPASQLLRRS